MEAALIESLLRRLQFKSLVGNIRKTEVTRKLTKNMEGGGGQFCNPALKT
jgi:hypothetical protein